MGCSLLHFFRMPRFLKLFMARHRISQVFNLIQLFCLVVLFILEFCRQGLGKSYCTFVVIFNDVKVSPCCLNISTQLITPIRHMNLHDHANRIEQAALTVRLQPSPKQMFDRVFSYRRLPKERRLLETWEVRPAPHNILTPLYKSCETARFRISLVFL
jgi:hypothetical protein